MFSIFLVFLSLICTDFAVTCSITLSPSTLSANFTTTFSVTITSTYSSNFVVLYDLCSNTDLIAVSGSSLYQTVGTSSTHSTYFITSGQKQVEAICMDSCQTLSITVLAQKLKLTYVSTVKII